MSGLKQGASPSLHDNSGFGQNSTTLTSSFEESKQPQIRSGAAQNEGMPYNRKFAQTDTAAL